MDAVRERGVVETVLFNFPAREVVATPAVLADHLSRVLSRHGVASRSSLRILAQRTSVDVSSAPSCFRFEPVRESERSDRWSCRTFQRLRAACSAVFQVSGEVVRGVSWVREFVDINAFWSLMRMLRNESNVFYKRGQYISWGNYRGHGVFTCCCRTAAPLSASARAAFEMFATTFLYITVRPNMYLMCGRELLLVFFRHHLA